MLCVCVLWVVLTSHGGKICEKAPHKQLKVEAWNYLKFMHTYMQHVALFMEAWNFLKFMHTYMQYVALFMYISLYSAYQCISHTAIPIIIEGHETAFNGFQYQFTTGKPLRDLKPTLNDYGNGSMYVYVYTDIYIYIYVHIYIHMCVRL